MPQLDTQLPLPNLNLYAGFSGLAFFYAVVYALTSSQENFICMVWSDVCCTAVSGYNSRVTTSWRTFSNSQPFISQECLDE